jgi:hypothetical protein
MKWLLWLVVDYAEIIRFVIRLTETTFSCIYLCTISSTHCMIIKFVYRVDF